MLPEPLNPLECSVPCPFHAVFLAFYREPLLFLLICHQGFM